MFNKQLIKIVLAGMIFSEIFSALGYFLPTFNQIGFIIVFLVTIVLSIINLEYGIYLALSELFIGSFGKIFYLEIGGMTLSIRVAIWLVVMLVWLGKTILKYIKDKEIKIAVLESKHWLYYFAFGLFIIWGGINGFWNKSLPSNLFFDFNGWLFFTYIFPWYEILSTPRRNEVLKNIATIFFVSCVWLSFKTLFLLYLFSHKTVISTFGFYYWMRKNQLGEITQMKSDFFRIFIQSQVYILTGFFIASSLAIKNKFNKHKMIAFLSSSIAVILISFSRSFWVGGFIGGLALLYFCWNAYRDDWKKYLKFISLIIGSSIVALALIIVIVKFPWPGAGGGQNALNLLTQRAGQISGEDGASSRWSLLPALWNKIKIKPLTGFGWGTTVTYKSSDPRVLEANPSGQYTTFAFEWGWLDIWLKLGLLGLVSYLALSFAIIKDCWHNIKNNSKDSWIYTGLVLGIISIFAVSFFSPYTNHPLGIGFLILTGAIVNSKAKS